SEDELYREEGVTNILLLGTDNRGNSSRSSRSDVMMILSINDNRREIVLSSLMRDTYITIPGRTEPDKLNSAHAYGGTALAIKTIETNYGIDIDKYVLVDFFAFMDIVDAMGGIGIHVNSEREMNIINDCIREINWKTGDIGPSGSDTSGFLTKHGDVWATGKQALGYVRNRTTGNSDFKRTERQRKVMKQIISTLRKSSAKSIIRVVDAAAGHMSTDYSRLELLTLAASAVDYKDYEIVQYRYPIDGSYQSATSRGMAVLSVDFDTNRAALLEGIYGNPDI
ncbi:MAG: LCP family protein, partial [Clostridia bacterium]|nr:LCP family protein [Clostridia bacterium]